MNKTVVDDTLISKRKEAYEEVLRQEKGIRTSLDLKISKELFEEFCRIGYIQQGMSGDWQETWKLTDFGKVQLGAYFDLLEQGERLVSLEKKLKGKIEKLEAEIEELEAIPA